MLFMSNVNCLSFYNTLYSRQLHIQHRSSKPCLTYRKTNKVKYKCCFALIKHNAIFIFRYQTQRSDSFVQGK